LPLKAFVVAAACGLLLFGGGCGGGTASPAAPVHPVASPTVSPVSTPPPIGLGAVEAVCRSIGYGEAKAVCGKLEAPTVLPLVTTAIDLLVEARPELFDTRNETGNGGYLVLDEKAYLEGMQTTLAGLGVCSAPEGRAGTDLRVKNTNGLDETYTILTAKGHIYRGFRSYVTSCTPAGFPLSPGDAFSYVRTAFFGYKCDAGVATPVPASGQLPVVCSGIVTATPKDANGVNTPAAIHGNDITWNLRSGADSVAVYPVLDGNIFNYIVQAKAVGPFSLCATIGGHEGCLNGQVTPYP
jgi:hypothetical protein